MINQNNTVCNGVASPQQVETRHITSEAQVFQMMYGNNQNDPFLGAVFSQQFKGEAHCTQFSADPANIRESERAISWGGNHWSVIHNQFNNAGNQYFTISTFTPSTENGKTKARRRKSLFARCHVIVVDDVGRGASAKVDPDDSRLPVPSYKLETSPDNDQWGYILSEPETDRAKVENLLDGMVAAKLCPDGSDPGMKGVTRYVRLPGGTNNKIKYVDLLGAPFKCRITHWQPNNKFTMDELAERFSINLNAPRSDAAESDIITDPDHPALKAYAEIFGLINGVMKSNGGYDAICFNKYNHSDSDSSNPDLSGCCIWPQADGTLNFKCHHGHCSGDSHE